MRAAGLAALHADPKWHYSDGSGTWRANYERAVEIVLEAVQPYMSVRPVLDRTAVRKLMVDALNAYVMLGTPGYYNYVDSFFALARPVPTREAIDRLLTLHYYDASWSKEHQGFRCVCGWLGENHVQHVRDAVLALLGDETGDES